MKEYKISPKQQAFADHYIETLNMYDSAIKAGYSDSYAKAQSYKLLENVGIKKYIDDRMNKMTEKRIATGEQVLQFLTKVMNGEVPDQFGLDPSLQDRLKASELLGKRHRLFTDKIEQSGTVEVVFNNEQDLED